MRSDIPGWQEISSKWYYFDKSGIMQTGWQKIDGKWYYLDPTSGQMVTAGSTTPRAGGTVTRQAGTQRTRR